MTSLQNEIKLLEKERDDYLRSAQEENKGIDRFVCELRAEYTSRLIRIAKAVENDIEPYADYISLHTPMSI